MTTAKPATPYRSGFCHSGRHDRCQGAWPTAVCDCACHQEPADEPEPEPVDVLPLLARHCPTCACQGHA